MPWSFSQPNQIVKSPSSFNKWSIIFFSIAIEGIIIDISTRYLLFVPPEPPDFKVNLKDFNEFLSSKGSGDMATKAVPLLVAAKRSLLMSKPH